ncbi:MAG: hypothetical protein EOO01_35015 [Chitinophagaceae bacterium]|nr:MAG: hypothetical protein EOO01_35015 [Chitinophagaceae bacterium]
MFTTCSLAVMVLLFVTSEDMIHHRNNFTRRFPHHPAELRKVMDMKVNSYYIAGEANGQVYLGNVTAPLTVTVVDSTLTLKKQINIILSPARDRFYSLQLSIQMPYFYLSDGRFPVVYRGIVGDWTATIWTENTAYFNAFAPMDSHHAAFRAISSTKHEHILGTFTVDKETMVKVNPLLDKQADGIFDTAGLLNYNSAHEKILYTYLYKNEYLVIDDALQSKVIRHTIDTTAHVRIKTSYNTLTKERKMASPGWTVNNRAQTYRDYLFINSAVIGKLEPEIMWKKASIIDVYNFTHGTYAFSFYVTNIMGTKMSSFVAGNDKIYALCGQYLSSYRLTSDFYKN